MRPRRAVRSRIMLVHYFGTEFYQSDVFAIGRIELARKDPLWKAEHLTGQGIGIGYPERAFEFQHVDRPKVVANGNHALISNPRHQYRKTSLDPRGERTNWLAFAPEVVCEYVEEFEPDVRNHPDSPVRFSWGIIDHRTAMQVRLLTEYVSTEANPNRPFVDEMSFQILHSTVRSACKQHLTQEPGGRRPRRKPLTATTRAHEEAVQAAIRLLTENIGRRLPLAEVASVACMSTWHFARVFRRVTGLTVHRYRLQLRLLDSLTRIGEHERQVADLALSLGFSSHAHFIDTCRDWFGSTPSRMAEVLHAPRLRQIEDVLERMAPEVKTGV